MILNYTTKVKDGSLKGWETKFREKVLAREKLHTIREDKNDRWKIGMTIHHSTGARTKNYLCFAHSTVEQIWYIKINPETKGVKIYTENPEKLNLGNFEMVLGPYGIERLSDLDGFDSVEQFWKWFDKPFKGKVIYFGETVPVHKTKRKVK